MSDDDNKKWWAASGDDASVAETRTRILDATAQHLRDIADRPLAWRRDGEPEVGDQHYRSIVVRVSQFWNDQADDECHLDIIGYSHDDPSGLHACQYDETPAGGDVCGSCAHDGILDEYEVVGGMYGSLIPAVEAFCHDGASQDMEGDDAFRPWAIVRLADGEVVQQRVGALVRPWLDLPTTRAPRIPVGDRILALAGDRTARSVMVDALLEAGDPRGDALAHYHLDAGLARTWLGALDPHVPRSALELVGGLPAAIGLYLDREPDRDERLPFAFRPAVRFLPGSERPIWPALAPARALGPLDEVALEDIATSSVPFTAEQVELQIEDPRLVTHVLAAFARASRQLPKLRVVRLAGAGITRAAIDAVRAAELAPLELEVTTRGEDAADHAADVVAWRLAGPISIAMYDADAQRASGWVVRPDGSIARRGYHRHATDARRDHLVGVLR